MHARESDRRGKTWTFQALSLRAPSRKAPQHGRYDLAQRKYIRQDRSQAGAHRFKSPIIPDGLGHAVERLVVGRVKDVVDEAAGGEAGREETGDDVDDGAPFNIGVN